LYVCIKIHQVVSSRYFVTISGVGSAIVRILSE
jgi:hypothetical protein